MIWLAVAVFAYMFALLCGKAVAAAQSAPGELFAALVASALWVASMLSLILGSIQVGLFSELVSR